MIGKALLSGLWAHPPGCFTVRFTVAFLTLERVSLYVHLSSLTLGATRRCRCLLRSDKGWVVMAFGLRHVISGSWLQRSPVSAWCCVASLTCVYGLVCVCFPFCFVCFLAFWPYFGCDDIMNWVLILMCPVLVCSGLVVWFCVLFGFVLCVFAVCLVYDGPMDYVQVLPQFSFAALNSRWPGNTNLHYCSCNVIQCGKRPGESHEGVGRKKAGT